MMSLSRLATCHHKSTGFVVLLFLTMPAYAEDLLFHYQLALQNDTKLRGTEASRDAIQDRLTQVKAGFYPTVSATATQNRNKQKVVTDSFIFSQPFFEAV